MRSPIQTAALRALNMRLAAAAMLVALAIVPIQAQQPAPATFRVLIDGVAAGSAMAVANLPADTTMLRQSSNPNLPSTQASAGQQASVIITTSDPALVSAIRAWVNADNSGYKDTVQRKTVELDRLGGTGPARYQLSDAWPSRIDTGTPTAITIVYQRLTIIP
jgi:hypothetical protein